MGVKQKRAKERRFVYIQCKVLTGWRSLKFRDAGCTGSRYPSSLGARPRPSVPGHVRASVRGRGAGKGSARSLRACAREDCRHGAHHPTVPDRGEQDVATM